MGSNFQHVKDIYYFFGLLRTKSCIAKVIMYVPIRNPKVSVARFNLQTEPQVVLDFEVAVTIYNTRNLYNLGETFFGSFFGRNDWMKMSI